MIILDSGLLLGVTLYIFSETQYDQLSFRQRHAGI